MPNRRTISFTAENPAVCTFAGNPLDRADLKRKDKDWLAAQMIGGAARVIAIRGDTVRCSVDGALDFAWVNEAQMRMLADNNLNWVFLGLKGDRPWFAVDMPALIEDGPGEKWIDLRSFAMQVEDARVAIAGQAKALLHWHHNHPFCACCGERTVIADGGYLRQCLNGDCKTQHFPRTDPVVIMLAIHKGKCLLGRGPNFPETMVSALAGFMEPGESIEEAVRRELHEEAGVRIGRVSYVASQPWPFPSSLMIGCFADALSADITPDGVEIETVDWYAKATVKNALAGKSRKIHLPPPLAIANRLLQEWVR